MSENANVSTRLDELHAKLDAWFATPEAQAMLASNEADRVKMRQTGVCPRAPHRGPQGPNEDLAQCPVCLMPSFGMRPVGETFGDHVPDCSLPVDHPSFCQPGGNGHQASEHVRGYWPSWRGDPS